MPINRQVDSRTNYSTRRSMPTKKKTEEKALEKDMAKKEELEFEVNNLEAPMISEME